MGNIIASISDLGVDDFDCPSSLLLSLNKEQDIEEDNFNEYAEELQLQEALMAMVCLDHNSYIVSPEAEGVQTPCSNPRRATSSNEIGESSHSFCEICMENKQRETMITVKICGHSFCADCIMKYVEVKIRNKFGGGGITCPGLRCEGVLEPEIWQPTISKNMLDFYNDTVCELSILEYEKFYCPFNNCSAILENDQRGYEVIRESECPECRRLFCAFCGVPWHAGMGCEEFQSLNEYERGSEDMKVRALAKENNWSRCRWCSMYVEKNEGCQHITCRCGAEWCYVCGAEWNETHYCER